MTPKDVLKAPKAVVQAGSWKVVTGKAKMPTRAFPLSRPFQLGRNWHWRVDVLEVAGTQLRLLTAYEPQREEFRAWLSYQRGSAYVILAQLEFHGTHPGWHCHTYCKDIGDIPPGETRPRNFMRLPSTDKPHRRVDFAMTNSVAFAKAFEFFRVRGPPAGALI